MPIIGEWIDLFRILHGVFNALIALAFLYQGWLGFRIRRARTGGGPRDFRAVRRHRINGPVLTLLGFLGYLSGVTLSWIDLGRILEFPIHHLTGLAVAILLAASYLLSRKIAGLSPSWRTPHFLMALSAVTAYWVQLFLGLNLLL